MGTQDGNDAALEYEGSGGVFGPEPIPSVGTSPNTSGQRGASPLSIALDRGSRHQTHIVKQGLAALAADTRRWDKVRSAFVYVVRPLRARTAKLVHDTVLESIHPRRFPLANIVSRDTHHTFIHTCDYPAVMTTSLLKGQDASACQEASYPL